MPGLDGIIIGPNDLSASLGLLGQPWAPEVLEVIRKIVTKSLNARIPIGIGCGSEVQRAAGWLERGAQIVLLGGDFSYLAQTAGQTVQSVRQCLQELESPRARDTRILTEDAQGTVESSNENKPGRGRIYESMY